MQHLRHGRVHALALASGKHDDGEAHGADSSTRDPANSLKDHQKSL
jgi:hypothetical protein